MKIQMILIAILTIFNQAVFAQFAQDRLFASYAYYHQFSATEEPALDSVVLHIDLKNQTALYHNISFENRKNGPAKVEESDFGTVVSHEISFADGKGYPLYTDYNKKAVYERKITIASNQKKAYIVEDKKAVIRWRLSQEFKTIGQFKCQKAMGTFRGRTYIAWFDRSIPVPIGPWKLHGLPGLIIEVEDESGQVGFALTNLAFPSPYDSPIKQPNMSELISLNEYLEIERQIAENYIDYMKSKLPRGARVEVTSVSKTLGLEKDYGFE
ncbi:MAG: hypothetical protein Sapg2KO_15520 [Saprospiraceae bacterium]